MTEFTDFIHNSLENIKITNSGEALWATMCLIPFLDGQVDETELDIIRTLLPKYVGQMREVGKNPIIDQIYRPFPGFNEADWPDLFEFVSHEWDLPEMDSEGNISLISVQLTAGNVKSALEEIFEQVQKSYNELMDQIIIPITEKDGTGVSERGIGTIPQRATEYFEEYVDSFVGIVAPFFEGSDDRRDFFLAAVMAIMFADGDNIGMERYFLFSIWDAFGFGSEVLTRGDWRERIGIERFHNFDIPTVLPVMSLDGSSEDTKSEAPASFDMEVMKNAILENMNNGKIRPFFYDLYKIQAPDREYLEIEKLEPRVSTYVHKFLAVLTDLSPQFKEFALQYVDPNELEKFSKGWRQATESIEEWDYEARLRCGGPEAVEVHELIQSLGPVKAKSLLNAVILPLAVDSIIFAKMLEEGEFLAGQDYIQELNVIIGSDGETPNVQVVGALNLLAIIAAQEGVMSAEDVCETYLKIALEFASMVFEDTPP